jgi:CelD/BcsL family acetyltransferase involved in cellulose biosynthesis
MGLDIITGSDALARIESPSFQDKWKSLHDACPWATGCQHPDFVIPWYQIYTGRFTPVVIAEEGADGALAGLLTLALDRDGTRLPGAGAEQAEYHCWITRGDDGGAFMAAAIDRIRAMFPRAQIALRYLPPGVPLGWMQGAPGLGKCCTLWPHRRPVMRIDEEAMEYQRRKKNHRQNYNRLKKLGSVGFQRISDHEHFRQVFDEICMQYDFRQAGLYRHMPFASDPLKKRFYLELHRRQLLHATVLTVDGEIAASHLGVVSKGQAVHLGINTHGPAFAAHSPGNLLLAMLGVMLAREKVEIFDLTPGGDAYKEHFATEHDEVFELTVFGSSARRLQAETLARAKSLSKAGLNAVGVRSVDVRAALDKVKNLGSPEPRRWLGGAGHRARAGLWVRKCAPDANVAVPDPLPIARNRLADVFKYDGEGSPVRRRAFLGMAMKRLERSCRLYSYAAQDQLMISCWAEVRDAEADAVLFDLVVHRQPDNGEVVRRFVEQLIAELSRAATAGRIYYRGALEPALQPVVRQCGFSETSGEGA